MSNNCWQNEVVSEMSQVDDEGKQLNSHDFTFN